MLHIHSNVIFQWKTDGNGEMWTLFSMWICIVESEGLTVVDWKIAHSA